jgi:hypothetical protein
MFRLFILFLVAHLLAVVFIAIMPCWFLAFVHNFEYSALTSWKLLLHKCLKPEIKLVAPTKHEFQKDWSLTSGQGSSHLVTDYQQVICINSFEMVLWEICLFANFITSNRCGGQRTLPLVCVFIHRPLLSVLWLLNVLCVRVCARACIFGLIKLVHLRV